MRRLHSDEAEQSVLGAILINPECFDDVQTKLKAEDFYQPIHQEIYTAMLGLQAKNIQIDWQTVGDATDITYLVDVRQSTPGAANVMAYAEIVRQRSRERQLFAAVANMRGLEEDEEATTEEIYDKAQALFNGLASEQPAETQVTMKESVKSVVQSLDDRLNGVFDASHVMTGFADVDKRVMGYRPSDFIVVGARPSMGKTALMLNIGLNCANRNGPALIFSMEMPSGQLTERLISQIGTIDGSYIRDPKRAPQSMWSSLAAAATTLKDVPLIIDDQAGLTIEDLRLRARMVHRKTPVKIIMADYLQLMRAGKKCENRSLEIAEISRGLKALAKELKVPVIALAQLNRSLESRPNKRPIMSDLRDGGSIEQDADVIHFVYRDEVYNPDSEFKGVAELITAKQRNGPVGTDFLRFEGQYSRFGDLHSDRAQSQYDRYGD